MNQPRFTLPSDSNRSHDADSREVVRRKIIATIQNALARGGMSPRFVKRFERELAFWKSMRPSNE